MSVINERTAATGERLMELIELEYGVAPKSVEAVHLCARIEAPDGSRQLVSISLPGGPTSAELARSVLEAEAQGWEGGFGSGGRQVVWTSEAPAE